jgi:hypothetical protein
MPSVFKRTDKYIDGFVDLAEFLNRIEELIPDDVVSDYYVKEASATLRIHDSSHKGAAMTEEQMCGNVPSSPGS